MCDKGVGNVLTVEEVSLWPSIRRWISRLPTLSVLTEWFGSVLRWVMSTTCVRRYYSFLLLTSLDPDDQPDGLKS